MMTLSSTDEFHKKSVLNQPMKTSIEASTFPPMYTATRDSPFPVFLFSLWPCAVQLPRTQFKNIFT